MINHNGEILPALPEQLLEIQRAAYYGDGIFETIRSFNATMPFWELHWARLQRGIRALEMELPASWTSSFIAGEIQKAGITNSRIRLTVWRGSGGLFMPENRQVNFLITTQTLNTPMFEWGAEGVSAVYCHSVKLPMDELSGIKMLGGARYVKAALECKKSGAEDGLLFNTEHRICEAVSSNISWIKDSCLYFPPPGEGQVLGTMQEHLLSLAKAEGWKTVPRLCKKKDLQDADEILLSNAIHGVRWIRSLEGKLYGFDCAKKIYHLLHQDLLNHLNQPRSPLKG
jgi:branched-chain amino acid aminotransferase